MSSCATSTGRPACSTSTSMARWPRPEASRRPSAPASGGSTSSTSAAASPTGTRSTSRLERGTCAPAGCLIVDAVNSRAEANLANAAATTVVADLEPVSADRGAAHVGLLPAADLQRDGGDLLLAAAGDPGSR